MTDSLSVTVEDTIAAKLADAPEAVGNALVDIAGAIDATLLGRVRSNADARLTRRSGRLQAGFAVETRVGVGGFVSSVSNDAPYAAILEYGGEIPAHVVVPKDGRALRFQGSAGAVFATATRMPDVHLPAHAFARDALRDLEPALTALAGETVVASLLEHLA